MASLLKELLPPLLFRELKKLKPEQYGWLGNYKTWSEAASKSVGYDHKIILNKVEAATAKVMNGEAVFERDSMLFDEPQHNWPLIAALMYVASANRGNLELIDFGGSLGSTYFQNRPFFKKLENVRWTVVEQAHFVATGKSRFTGSQLHFSETIEAAMQEKHTDTLLLSSVLQYIEKPYELLQHAFSFNFKTIIIDRMPFNTRPENRICVQRVHPSIYEASYPCHLLSIPEFTGFFERNGYRQLAEFDALDGKTDTYQFKGFIFEK